MRNYSKQPLNASHSSGEKGSTEPLSMLFTLEV